MADGAVVAGGSEGLIAETPRPPCVAVIFTSVRSVADDGYTAMSAGMAILAGEQPGYLGVEAARDAVSITVSYWRDEEAARGWKAVAEHPTPNGGDGSTGTATTAYGSRPCSPSTGRRPRRSSGRAGCHRL